MPTLTVIAGANGCGKTTLTKWARAYFQQSSILDPDAVAVDLSVQNTGVVSPVEAGKQVLRSAEEFLAKKTSFTVETTLSSSTYLRMMKRARKIGFDIRLFYIDTESRDINRLRIQSRVLKGGHDVPEADHVRRYPRSFANLPEAMNVADEGVLLDNSSVEGHRIVGLKRRDGVWEVFEPSPSWVQVLRIES